MHEPACPHCFVSSSPGAPPAAPSFPPRTHARNHVGRSAGQLRLSGRRPAGRPRPGRLARGCVCLFAWRERLPPTFFCGERGASHLEGKGRRVGAPGTPGMLLHAQRACHCLVRPALLPLGRSDPGIGGSHPARRSPLPCQPSAEDPLTPPRPALPPSPPPSQAPPPWSSRLPAAPPGGNGCRAATSASGTRCVGGMETQWARRRTGKRGRRGESRGAAGGGGGGGPRASLSPRLFTPPARPPHLHCPPHPTPLPQVAGDPERPRLAVFRSNNHIYAQVSGGERERETKKKTGRRRMVGGAADAGRLSLTPPPSPRPPSRSSTTRPATPWPPRPPCRPPFGRSWAAATAATRCGRRERKRGGGGEGQPAAAASAETDPSRRPDPSPHQPLFLFSPHRKRRSWWASRSRSCARPPRSKRSPLTGAAKSTTAGSRPWRTRPGRAACSFERAGGAVRGGGRAPLVCVLFFPFFLHSLDRWVSVCRVCERERE